MKKMKRFQAIFFDWDGTAVVSRTAPAEDVVDAMRPLLEQGVRLCIISGTTYENIASGKLHVFFDEKQQKNLFLGLARGAVNYRFEEGRPVPFGVQSQDISQILRIHDAAYAVHRRLLEQYGLPTDIVFSRPGYCKIDLMVAHTRVDRMFLQPNEIARLRNLLVEHGIPGGLHGLTELACEIALECTGERLYATADAKYLELGCHTKRGNVTAVWQELQCRGKLEASEVCIWGDEFLEVDSGVWGSDAAMLVPELGKASCFDVSDTDGIRPKRVRRLGGGPETFLSFLRAQANG